MRPLSLRGSALQPLFLTLFLAATSSLAGPADPTCTGCHEDLVAAYARTTHGRAFAHAPNQAAASCTSCHAGAAAHAEAGDASLIAKPSTQPAREANATCLACHANQRHTAAWEGSRHEAAEVRCADCHGIHGSHSARVADKRDPTPSDVCLSCHTAQRKNLTQRSRHPLREGKMACSSCHDPHGGGTEHMIKADSVNDLCMSCHQQMRGPFLWEHSPVREDCTTCHTAHGSNHEKLLVARPVQLCQSCHQQGRHQTIAGAPKSIWVSNRACLNCHPQIHGSNHPSGPLFQR